MKKIIIFCDFYLPENNGLVQYINNLYTPLIEKKKIKIEVVTFKDKNQKEFEIINNVPIHRIDCYRILGNTYSIPKLKSYNKIFNELKNKDYDFVNTHTRFFISSLLGLRFSKIINKPLIHTEHGSGFVPHSNKIVKIMARIYDEIFGRLVISKAQIVSPVSKKGISFCKKLGAKKIQVIHNGISKNFEKIKTSNIKKDELNICFVGRTVKEKGLKELIKACSKLNFKYKLHIIGDGNYLEQAKKLSKQLNINSRFYGFQNRNFVLSHLKKMDVFINPSYAEGFPTSVLEAGISDCQIIATDVGGTKEILKKIEGTYLIKPKNVTQIISSLNKINKTKNLKTTKLKQHILKEFEWNNLSEKNYSQIISK